MEADFGILTHVEGVQFLPANIDLAAVEVSLISEMSREYMLKEYIETVAPYYDYIIADCSPSLDMLTINALAAATPYLFRCRHNTYLCGDWSSLSRPLCG